MKWLALALLLSASAATAQVEPTPSSEDSRIGIVHHEPGQKIGLRATPGADLAVLLPRGERIETVTLGDTVAWHASVSEAQDGLTLFAAYPVSDTSLSVGTNASSYQFTLTAAFGASVPYLVRVENGGSTVSGKFSPQIWTPPVVVQPGLYKLSGNKELRPSVIRDDGAKMYIEWSGPQAIPAVFSLNNLGREEMVNGYMRGGAFTIDRIYDRLIFRIDKAEATARRYLPKVKK